jgi:citrate lyase gamma subunit
MLIRDKGVAVTVVAATFLVVVCTTDKAIVLTIDSERQRQFGIEMEVAAPPGLHTEQDKEPEDGPDAAKGKAMPH